MLIKDLYESNENVLTFVEFQAAKRESVLKKEPQLAAHWEETGMENDPILVYPGDLIILVNPGTWKWGGKGRAMPKYNLIIGNEEYPSNDLEGLEKELYWGFYATEVVDSKDIPRGQPSEPEDWEEYVS